MDENRHRLRQIALGRLESLERAGVLQLPKPGTAAPAEAASAEVAPGETASGGVAAAAAIPASTTREEEKDMPQTTAWKPLGGGSLFEADVAPREISDAPTLAVLEQEVVGCTRCDELARTRTQTVFGVGSPHARLCFLGEAPGADEDRLGEPFVGRAGQLLTKIIEACGMRREDVYICNILKCRPPGNRNPLPVEAANCRRFLERQLELIGPEFICCLGAVAAQNLLNTTAPIGRLRGKVHAYREARIVCTYHPAYLLRNPAAKKDTWEDMKLLMREMGVGL
jgi:uracil-DNA glycosylase family 4